MLADERFSCFAACCRVLCFAWRFYGTVYGWNKAVKRGGELRDTLKRCVYQALSQLIYLVGGLDLLSGSERLVNLNSFSTTSRLFA